VRTIGDALNDVKGRVLDIAEKASGSSTVLQGYLDEDVIVHQLARVVNALEDANKNIGHHVVEEACPSTSMNDRLVKDFHFRKDPSLLRRNTVSERFGSTQKIVSLKRVLSMLNSFETVEDLKDARNELQLNKIEIPYLNSAISRFTKLGGAEEGKEDEEVDPKVERDVALAAEEVKKLANRMADKDIGFSSNDSIVVSFRLAKIAKRLVENV